MSHFIQPIFAPVLLMSSLDLRGFPPASYYTLYGIVRDQVRQTLNVESAQIEKRFLRTSSHNGH